MSHNRREVLISQIILYIAGQLLPTTVTLNKLVLLL